VAREAVLPPELADSAPSTAANRYIRGRARGVDGLINGFEREEEGGPRFNLDGHPYIEYAYIHLFDYPLPPCQLYLCSKRYWALESEFTETVLWRHDMSPPSDHCMQQVQEWCALAKAVRTVWWMGGWAMYVYYGVDGWTYSWVTGGGGLTGLWGRFGFLPVDVIASHH
jgi:hypothetical protein